jgi:hypothetical protein
MLSFATRLFLRYAAFRIPVNDNTGNTTFPTGAESITFVGRPFPLDEAPQHLARLRRWGSPRRQGQGRLYPFCFFICPQLPRWSTLQVNDDQSSLDAVTTAFTVVSPPPRFSGSLPPR